MHGTGNGAFGFYGWVIGKTLDITGNTQVHYDETLESGAQPYPDDAGRAERVLRRGRRNSH